MITRARSFSTKALRVYNNVARQQFKVAVNSAEAVLGYEKRGDSIVFKYTEVPKQFQGKGVGKLLAKHAFDYAASVKLNVICQCHFLAKYYQENKENYKDLKVELDLE